jgi:hypothetical protein
MAKRIALAILAIAVLLSFVAGFWTLTYPDAADPKNMKYVLWKHGLYHLEPRFILDGLYADPERDKFVIGRSKEEIEAMFGPLIPAKESPNYIPSCFDHSAWPADQTYLVSINLWWAVAFQNNRAVDFRLVKGC